MDRVVVASAEGWQEACSAAFVPLRVRSADPRFRADLSQIDLGGGVSLTRVVSGASEVYRSDQVIRTSPADAVLVSLHRAGSGTVLQHGREVSLAPGAAVMYDASAPYALRFPKRIAEVVLQLPRRALPMRGSRFADLLATRLPGSVSLDALTALALSVTQPAAPSEAAALGDALTGLLQGAVTGGAPVPRESLTAALQQHVRDHAADPDLDPEALARTHHVSLRLVQQCFERAGTSAATAIRDERLRRARILLVSGVPVSSAAVRAGFRSPDTFSRAYRRRFGAPPSVG